MIDLILSIPPEDGLIGLSGIAYDSGSELLYVGRFPRSSAGEFPDYTSSGTVLAINSFGEIETSFQVGPAPSQILLRDSTNE